MPAPGFPSVPGAGTDWQRSTRSRGCRAMGELESVKRERTEAQRLAQAKAAQVAAEKRKGRPPTEKELAARERMRQGRLRKAEERRRLREGNVKPAVTASDGEPDLEPAEYPARPAETPQSAPDAPETVKGGESHATGPGKPASGDRGAALDLDSGAVSPAAPKQGSSLGTFIKRGLGL